MESSESKTWYIYCHTAPNGKRYIGQTRTDPEVRWGKGRGYSSQQYFKRAIDKYSWDNIEHAVLCSVSNQEYANFLEQWFIEKWDTTNPENGYNCAKGGAGPTGVTWDDERKQAFSEYMTGENNPMYGRNHSEETRARISEKLCGRKLSPEMRAFRTRIILESNKRRRKPVRQLDLDGNVIRTYSGMGEIEAETGFNHSSIWKVCHGKMLTAYGFKWEFVDDELREESRKALEARPKNSIAVIQCDFDGNEVARFESMSDAERKTGLNRNKISACCYGKQDTYAGYTWRLEHPAKQRRTGRSSKPVSVVQLDMSGNEIARFESVKQAMDATGHDRHRIVECCKGERGHYRDYRWRYANSDNAVVNQPGNGLSY